MRVAAREKPDEFSFVGRALYRAAAAAGLLHARKALARLGLSEE